MTITVGEAIVNQILAKKRELELIEDNLEDLKLDLCGMEITYNGNYAVIDHITMDYYVRLYVEGDRGASYFHKMPLEELLPCIRLKA